MRERRTLQLAKNPVAFAYPAMTDRRRVFMVGPSRNRKARIGPMARRTNFLMAAGVALAAAAAGAGAAAADLEVRIEGLRSAEGDVRVALHRRAAGVEFPGDGGMVDAAFDKAAPGALTFVFAGLAPGEYAVAAFHDADGDGELGTNLLGIPSEGFGFSRGARGFMGPPAFADAAVTVGADDVSTTVPIDYLWGEE